MNTRKPQLRLVVVGHVDHGKSTLIGRLLHDTDSLPDGKLEELKRVSERRGMPLEWSFVLDAFQAERDQAVTIDTTQIWFKTEQRDVVIIDAPGHREFLKNMISGAANADAAVLVIDAAEGVREQTRRHAYLLRLLGMKQIIVAVNKMDLINQDQQRFRTVTEEMANYLQEIGLQAVAMIPISARHGDNIATHAKTIDWYNGASLIEALDSLERTPAPVDQPLRFPVQDVYKFDERRIIAGRIESGRLKVGDELIFSPSNRRGIVRSIEAWNAKEAPIGASAGESIGITLDEQIYVERGDIASHAGDAPILSDVFRATVFWLGEKPLEAGKQLKLKLGTSEANVTIQSIDRVIDTQDLKSGGKQTVERNDVAEVTIRARKLMALDEYSRLPHTGQFVLIDEYDTVGGGSISMDGYPDQRQNLSVKSKNIYAVEHLLDVDARARRNNHYGAVFWFTGLSGAGKSTLAMLVERALFDRGRQVFVLDGDNVRRGLNADLGFSPDDRAENIRRIGEVAALFGRAGNICITAFISPYRADRDRARQAAPESFHEIYIKADLSTCEERDPKGLYKKARAGEIPEFTGISAPYEPPAQPDLEVDTAELPIEACVDRIVDYIESAIALEAQRARAI
ncbi:MAG: adenylyl-sulfate kinase [Alphaproteobacteria bacterium]|nr:adenylyl-sulfate kinase [Alphaproteobacteria bacterium]MAS46343.1 adenylyl-sulfate kinase [Alphaproteobacteria bacterium]MAX95472.1 adenylyl-sulfate kinase [Alphaproteobacteria bacterium]MBN54390.1 adenylyl-sulfate kinase [Alphaproteobacteria bacterium]OUT42050.1 MAG: adenylyl-sulfate kinase [Micavibrio sp. TMED2]|tara:strand:+ start:2957 stop:4840 length:1884 start_codon:yes stop_codon:yes gene_type:complete